MALKKNVLTALQDFLPKKALLIDDEVSTRKAGGLHTEEAILAKVIVRPETTEEVSKTALFLSSDLSSGITGEIIHVDTGYNIMGI